ncbi:MAG: cytochrome c [Sphingobacteriales bacterium]|nr:cytochrome c [Sphingobacteriales bacterium]
MKYLLLLFAVSIAALSFSSFSEKKVVSFQQKSTPMTRGKVIYTQYCLPCHQADGGGVLHLNPPLIKTSYVLGSKVTLVEILTKGLNKGVEIDGDSYTNPMPAQNLTDQQVADVLTFVRNSFGNKASAVSAAEVKAIRAKLK